MSTRCTEALSDHDVVHVYTECFDLEDNIYLEVETTDFSASPGRVVLSMPRGRWDEVIADYMKNRQATLSRIATQEAREKTCLMERYAHEWEEDSLFPTQFFCKHCRALKPPAPDPEPEHPKAVYEIALTLDHSFGLMGEGSDEREALLRQAHQLWEHHVKPLEKAHARQ